MLMKVKRSMLGLMGALVMQGWAAENPWLHEHGIYHGELVKLDEASYYKRVQDDLYSLNSQLEQMLELEIDVAEQFIATNQYGWERVETNSLGEVIGEVVGLDERGVPIYSGLYSLEAVASSGITNLWSGGSSGLNLDGTGTEVAMWDGGIARLTHEEFQREGGTCITNLDGSTGYNNWHATPVAGVMGAAGVNPAVRGSAPAIERIHCAYHRYDLSTMLVSFMENEFQIS